MVTKDRYWKILWFDYGGKRQHWASGSTNQVCGKNKIKSKCEASESENTLKIH